MATAVVALAVAAAFAGLGDDDEPADSLSGATPQATPGTDGTASSPAGEPSAGASALPTDLPSAAAVQDPARAAAVQAAIAPERTAADARTALELVLSARAAANTALLRGVLDGDVTAAATAAATMDAASDDLEAVIGAWQDSQVGQQVRSGFDLQAVASRAYATAVEDGDATAANQARADMGSASRVLGTMLESLTGGRITAFTPPEDASQLRSYVDAYAAGDTASASLVEEWLTGRLGREGVALAAALAGEVPGATTPGVTVPGVTVPGVTVPGVTPAPTAAVPGTDPLGGTAQVPGTGTTPAPGTAQVPGTSQVPPTDVPGSAEVPLRELPEPP